MGKYKNILIDFDGTLTSFDVLDYLAECNGTGNESARLKVLSQSGKIKGLRALENRIDLLRGMSSESILAFLSKKEVLRPGYGHLTELVKKYNLNLIIISGNIEPVIKYYAEVLGANEIFCTEVGVDHKGSILGMKHFNKSIENVSNFFLKNNLEPSETIAVGDDIFDIPFFEFSNLSVAFNAKRNVKNVANFDVEGDLRDLAFFLKSKIDLELYSPTSFFLKSNELFSVIASRSIIFNIGRSCFTRCIGCYNHFSKNPELISKEYIVNFLIFLKENNLTDKVTFGGGDPLTRPDIIAVLKETKKIGFTVNLDTVGSAFLSDTSSIFFGVHKIKKIDLNDVAGFIDLLGVPIDSTDNSIALKFREGRDNLVDEQKEIINLTLKYNIPLCVNTVLGSYNINSIERIWDLIAQYQNIVKWQIFQFMPIGPLGSKNQDMFNISNEEFDEITTKIKKKSIGSHIKIEAKSISKRINKYLIIDSDGDIWLPEKSEERVIIGNIRPYKE